MSSSTDTPQLNTLGFFALAASSGIAVNLTVTPLCALKNRQMAGRNPSAEFSKFSFSRSYRGYCSSVVVDTFAIFTANWMDNYLKGSFSPLFSAIAAGVLASPVTAIGEGLAANRQVDGLSYWQGLRRVLRLEGVLLTIARDAPYTWASLWLSRQFQFKIEEKNRKHGSPLNSLFIQAVSGGAAGLLAGIATTPVDLIKLRVQTSRTPLSILHAIHFIFVDDGLAGFFRAWRIRGTYIAGAVATWNIANNTFPHFFPGALRMNN